MARADVAELYRELRNTEFGFVPRGEHHLHDIYNHVKARYPHLCDDSFLCADNCSRGHQQPEWRHTTRKALWSKKADTGTIRAGKGRGYWQFR